MDAIMGVDDVIPISVSSGHESNVQRPLDHGHRTGTGCWKARQCDVDGMQGSHGQS
jgi:hypothetical protein